MDYGAGEETPGEQWEEGTTEGGASVIIKLDDVEECL